jgi:FixJ family two-component response regulator
VNSTPIVYIVDDDPAVADALAEMVRGMQLTPAGYENAQQFLADYDPDQHSCLILDLRLPGMSGIELQQELDSRGHSLPIIMITGHGDVPSCVRAVKLGALEFLEKPYSPEQLRGCIVRALELDAQRRQRLARQAEIEERLSRLTAEEMSVAKLVATGYTNKEIAAKLDISLRTVQFRRASSMNKLNVESRAELVQSVLLGQASASRTDIGVRGGQFHREK